MFGKHPSIETRLKRGDSLRGSNHPMFGKHWNEEQRQKIRESKLGQHHTDEAKHKISKALLGKQVSEETRCKLKLARVGFHPSEEAKKHMRLAKLGSKGPMFGRRGSSSPLFGRKASAETKQKMRIATMKRIEKLGPVAVNVGLHESDMLDQQERVDAVKIIRGYPIKALGYVVDGYCPDTNTVYEVYEQYHDRQVQEDLQRETEICNLLSCDFVILRDRP
jgi:hypothetical protein